MPALLLMRSSARSMITLIAAWLVVCAIAVSSNAAENVSEAEALEFFEKEVRPVLVERCYECHSGKTDEPKGSLRVDSRAALMTGGDTGPAIIPGDAKGSLLIDAINYGDLYEMPPKSKLPAKEIAALTRWVELGAPWPGGDTATATVKEDAFDLEKRRASHWCWQPIGKPTTPSVKDNAWPRDALDRFILARLEKAGLTPAGEADRATLLRRVTFDLTGLPPTPEELQAFLTDDSPTAYERAVDRLLASPRFGERWGRHWLDLVRYAESRGHEFDYNIPNVWHYRDYVIRALNADVPYDQFVTEQVAGDLLRDPRRNPSEGFNESILGTGFWFLGEWVHSPVDIRQDECDRFDNMVDVFGKTFLGLTIGCARCHDHKFDALAQTDYYALTGYLQSSAYRQARFDSDENNRHIALQLDVLDREAAPHIAAAVTPRYEEVVARMDGYLLAARDVLDSGVKERTPAGKEQLAASARKYGVDPERLAGWIVHLRAARSIEDDPFHEFAQLSSVSSDDSAVLRSEIDAMRADWREQLARVSQQREDLDVVVDFATSRDSDWFADGVTFGLGPRRAGELQLAADDDAPLVEIAEYGSARRDPLFSGLKLSAGTERASGRLSKWNRAGRTIRTPTFEIRRTNVFYLVRGTGHAYAVVDSHRMINGPLHGSLLKDIKTGDKLTWIGHNLDRYRGHGAHMEFIAEGDEPLEVLMVVQSDSPPGDLLGGPNRMLLAALDRTREATIADVAHQWQQAFAKSYLALAGNRFDSLPHPSDAARLINWMLQHPELCRATDDEGVERKVKQAVAEYRRRRDELVSQIQWESRTAPVMWDGDAQDERLLVRGNSKTAGDPVPRGMPIALSGPHRESNLVGSGRRDLARQLVDPANPLVSRVIVNRLWHHLFGRGLSASVDNFGVLGTEPTHPQLLDYLASELIRDGWSQKRMIRRLVLSSTYRMASSAEPGSDEADPANLLLHRQNVRRLEAEAIRDTLLALSGRLDNRMYGKSVNVFLTPFMQGRGRPPQGPLDGNGRRSVYISIRRNFLSPMMLAFDTPQPFNTVGRRNVSNVPAQALTLMNDPLVIDQARMWARRLLAETATTDKRLTEVYEMALARLPTEAERAAAIEFLNMQGREYGVAPEKVADDERVWTDLCHVLINAKEFIFIN